MFLLKAIIYSFMCFLHCQVMKVLLEVVVWFQNLYDLFKYLETNQSNCLSNLHSCPSQDLVPQDADLIQMWVFWSLLLEMCVMGPGSLLQGQMWDHPSPLKRQEYSHCLRQIVNVTSGNFTELFKVLVDMLVTWYDKCMCETLRLLWKSHPCIQSSALLVCLKGAGQYFCLCLFWCMSVTKVYYYYCIYQNVWLWYSLGIYM